MRNLDIRPLVLEVLLSRAKSKSSAMRSDEIAAVVNETVQSKSIRPVVKQVQDYLSELTLLVSSISVGPRGFFTSRSFRRAIEDTPVFDEIYSMVQKLELTSDVAERLAIVTKLKIKKASHKIETGISVEMLRKRVLYFLSTSKTGGQPTAYTAEDITAHLRECYPNTDNRVLFDLAYNALEYLETFRHIDKVPNRIAHKIAVTASPHIELAVGWVARIPVEELPVQEETTANLIDKLQKQKLEVVELLIMRMNSKQLKRVAVALQAQCERLDRIKRLTSVIVN
jgi:hypothetical protein